MRRCACLILVTLMAVRGVYAREPNDGPVHPDTVVGVASPASDPARQAAVSFPRVLVARPNVDEYDKQTRHLRWLAAVIEMGVLTALTIDPAIHSIDPDVFGHSFDAYRDYAWSVDVRRYVAWARMYGASHVVYSEVTAGDGDAAMLHVRIIEMPGARDAAWAHVAIDPSDPSALIDACLTNLYEVLGRPAPQETAGAIMGGMDGEQLASWGRAIAAASTDSAAVAERAGELLAMHPDGAGRYVAARFLARAGRYEQAAETVEDLGGGAAVMAARYYRYGGELEEARQTLAGIAGEAAALTWESDMELFLIDAWDGRIEGDGPAPGAGEANGEVLLYKALATVHDTDVLVDYRPAATAYGEAIGTDAFGAIMEIGERCRRGGSLHAAQRAFGKAVAMAPEDSRGWKAYARSFIDLGDSSGAIRISLNAVELEPLSRETFLLTAGRMLDGTGRLEDAAAAIDTYIAAGGSHPEVVAWQTRLAAAEGDCAWVLERAASMDKRWRQRPEIVSVLRQCGDEAPEEMPVSLAMDARPRLRKGIRWALGVSGGALAAGGMVAGLRANSRLEPLHDSYMASRDKGEVQSLRTELEETLTVRTIAYTLASVGAAILTLDIAIPAVRR